MNAENAFSLAGKTALITGGGSGLGYAMARCMIAAGATVVIAGRTEGTVTAAAAELGEKAIPMVYDVSRTDTADAFVADVLARTGRIDILVNNAGNHCKKPIEEMTVAEFEAVLDVHVVGAFALTKALVPSMKQNGGGSVLFTASMASFIGTPLVSGYQAAKTAYLGLIRGMSSELSPSGIRVNGIAPGWIDTPMLHKAIDGDTVRTNKILGRTPMQCFGKPDDIGWAAVYLSSPAASFVSGHVLVVDGGALIGF